MPTNKYVRKLRTIIDECVFMQYTESIKGLGSWLWLLEGGACDDSEV